MTLFNYWLTGKNKLYSNVALTTNPTSTTERSVISLSPWTTKKHRTWCKKLLSFLHKELNLLFFGTMPFESVYRKKPPGPKSCSCRFRPKSSSYFLPQRRALSLSLKIEPSVHFFLVFRVSEWQKKCNVGLKATTPLLHKLLTQPPSL